jgi:hypothetical protein
MKLGVIWDLDNCLTDDRARISRIDWSQTDPERRYSPYHEGCENDPPNSLGVAAFYAWHNGSRATESVPIIFTARPEKHRDGTNRWIERYLHPLSQAVIIMRQDGVHKTSADLKRDMLYQCRIQLSDVSLMFAFDDRAEIVEMYRREGLIACMLACHGEDPYKPPQPTPEEELAFPRPTHAPDVLRHAVSLLVGRIMEILFPRGINLRGDDEFRFWHLFELAIVKLSRAANSKFASRDSLDDMINYLAMLQALPQPNKEMFK